MAKMLGALTPVGVGGKACACCKARVAEKRTAKRRDRQAWRREATA